MNSVGLYSPAFVTRLLDNSITIFRVEYDSRGNKIFDEGELASGEDTPSFFSGIFNAELLDSDYLNQQKYMGSITDSDNMNEEEKEEKLLNDIGKYTNLEMMDVEASEHHEANQ